MPRADARRAAERAFANLEDKSNLSALVSAALRLLTTGK